MRWQEMKEALAHSLDNHCSSPYRLRLLHGRAITSGLRRNVYISAALVTKYFSLGDSQSARFVFDAHREGPTKPILWNSFIRGYLRTQSPASALDAYLSMIASPRNCEPDNHTYHLAIAACSRLSEFELGYQIAQRSLSEGFGFDLFVGTARIGLYSNAGDLGTARDLFDKMGFKDAVAWNSMISGYSRVGRTDEAMGLFKSMRFAYGILPTEATLVSVVSGCWNPSLISSGKVIHGHAFKIGYERNVNVSNCLLAMYIDCDCLESAFELFDRMISKDAISWSTMIGGYVENKQPYHALELFHSMVVSTRILPTRPVLLNVLLACAELGDWRRGEWVEEKYLIGNQYGIEMDASLITALIYMYAKSGKMEISMKFLEDDVVVREDVVAWNAMIKACTELKLADWVFELTLKMQRRGINPDSVTFLTLIPLVSSIPHPRKGMEAHTQIMKRGFVSYTAIANSLVDMYAKFGSIGDSYKIYDDIQEKDVVSWSSIIKAHAWNGNVEQALNLFQLMRKTETKPNHFTFLAILSACSHAGYVEKGLELFESMEKEYGLKPSIEHFTCMVDVFSRVGLLNEAYSFLSNGMPTARASVVHWGALLNACRLHCDSLIGEAAAMHLFHLEPRNAANYLMLADIYMSSGRVNDANLVLRLLRAKGLKEQPGCSWLEEG